MNAEAGPSRPRMDQNSQKSFAETWPVDMDSPFLIVKAAGLGAAAGALTGGTYGVVKSVNPFQVSLRMGTAWGFVFFQFFALREYIVSPLLVRSGTTESHQARYRILRNPRNDGRYPPNLSYVSTEQLRNQRVLDSGVSGFLSGCLLRLTTSGLRIGAMLPAGLTGLLFASAAQYGINNLRVSRLKMLAARQEGQDPPTVDVAEHHPEPSQRISPPGGGATGWGVLQDPTKPVAEPAKSLPAKIMGVASAVLPVRSLSDQEYLDVLLKKQAKVEKRLSEIAEEEEMLFEKGKQEETGSLA